VITPTWSIGWKRIYVRKKTARQLYVTLTCHLNKIYLLITIGCVI